MPKPDPLASHQAAELLAAEFNYIAQTAFQANEDRARVASFYLIAVGSLVAALFSTQLLGPQYDAKMVALAFSGLFFVLTLLGTGTILQLARLRAAWHESMLAMNQVKDYWIRHSKEKDLKQAFRWDADSLPPKYKVNSISYYQALEVALLSGLTFGAAAYFFQVGTEYTRCLWAFTISLGMLAFVLQLWLYKRHLRE